MAVLSISFCSPLSTLEFAPCLGPSVKGPSTLTIADHSDGPWKTLRPSAYRIFGIAVTDLHPNTPLSTITLSKPILRPHSYVWHSGICCRSTYWYDHF
ncbi:hypothetical protein DFH29DRAFT_109548 [Suillus ampliporus]|nr:hypothetical protein DFH29DRAFT_109548 [Suillus ampliporus]